MKTRLQQLTKMVIANFNKVENNSQTVRFYLASPLIRFMSSDETELNFHRFNQAIIDLNANQLETLKEVIETTAQLKKNTHLKLNFSLVGEDANKSRLSKAHDSFMELLPVINQADFGSIELLVDHLQETRKHDSTHYICNILDNLDIHKFSFGGSELYKMKVDQLTLVMNALSNNWLTEFRGAAVEIEQFDLKALRSFVSVFKKAKRVDLTLNDFSKLNDDAWQILIISFIDTPVNELILDRINLKDLPTFGFEFLGKMLRNSNINKLVLGQDIFERKALMGISDTKWHILFRYLEGSSIRHIEFGDKELPMHIRDEALQLMERNNETNDRCQVRLR